MSEADDKRWALIEQIARDVTGLKGDVTGLKADVTGVKADVTGLKKDQESRWILVEQMSSDMKAMGEAVSQIPVIAEKVDALQSDMTEVKGKLVVHEQILREHSADLKEIKQIVGTQMETITELKAASHTHA